MSIYIFDIIYSYNQFQLSINLQSHFFYLKNNTSTTYNRTVSITFKYFSAQKFDPGTLLRLSHKRYSKLLKTSFTSITQN